MSKSKALTTEDAKDAEGVKGERILIDMLCPCECCVYSSARMNAGGGWCYMWRSKPVRCTQFSKIEGMRVEGRTLILPS